MDREIYYQVYRIEKTHWWYAARRSLIADLISQWVSDTNMVLDAGCGTGVTIEYFASKMSGEFFGFDISRLAVGFSKDRGIPNLLCADGTVVPIADGFFDLITALDVVEHIEDDTRFFVELKRLLRPRGKLIIFVPALMSLWGEHDVVAHHFRRYSLPELKSKLSAHGFRILKLSYANTLLFPVIYLARQWLRRFRANKPSRENDLHPKFANSLLLKIFAFEKYLIRFTNLPIGVSLVCVAERN